MLQKTDPQRDRYGATIEFEFVRAMLLIAIVAWSVLVLLPAVVGLAPGAATAPGTP